MVLNWSNLPPKKPEKEVISMRISVDVLMEVGRKATAIGIGRNEFINQCIPFTHAHMDNDMQG